MPTVSKAVDIAAEAGADSAKATDATSTATCPVTALGEAPATVSDRALNRTCSVTPKTVFKIARAPTIRPGAWVFVHDP